MAERGLERGLEILELGGRERSALVTSPAISPFDWLSSVA